MITTQQLTDSGILPDSTLFALGNDWFKDQVTGQCYKVEMWKGRLTVVDIRFSNDKTKQLRRRTTCAQCGEIRITMNVGTTPTLCKECRRIKANRVNLEKWRKKKANESSDHRPAS